MKRVRQKGTRPEMLVGAALRKLGCGYRKNDTKLPGSPDFVNRSRGWALFVQGCFWHHHRCRRGTTPTRNREFWTDKFDGNRRRDARKVKALRKLGFRVVLVWECEVFAGVPMARKLRMLATRARGATVKLEGLVDGSRA